MKSSNKIQTYCQRTI